MTYSAAAKAYRVSRQHISAMAKRQGLIPTDFKYPESIWKWLLAGGRQSRIRTMLSDPAERERITAELAPLPFYTPKTKTKRNHV